MKAWLPGADWLNTCSSGVAPPRPRRAAGPCASRPSALASARQLARILARAAAAAKDRSDPARPGLRRHRPRPGPDVPPGCAVRSAASASRICCGELVEAIADGAALVELLRQPPRVGARPPAKAGRPPCRAPARFPVPRPPASRPPPLPCRTAVAEARIRSPMRCFRRSAAASAAARARRRTRRPGLAAVPADRAARSSASTRSASCSFCSARRRRASAAAAVARAGLRESRRPRRDPPLAVDELLRLEREIAVGTLAPAGRAAAQALFHLRATARPPAPPRGRRRGWVLTLQVACRDPRICSAPRRASRAPMRAPAAPTERSAPRWRRRSAAAPP